ncbi:MAG TPA: peptidylprolyl isomerase [Gemmatimonadales bacterium]|jgi:cyclophilin family peptidyl-prolyl cis-trans isomerase/HEAT repeat protein
MSARCHRLAVCAALTLSSTPAVAQAPGRTEADTALQRLLVAEDARGTSPEGLDPLLASLKGGDSLLRRVAVRGLGRFQRPELGRLLLPYLQDPTPSIRAEAANAIAQSLRRVRRGVAASDTAALTVPAAASSFTKALESEKDSTAIDALAQSLGRLPFPHSAETRRAEQTIRTRLATRGTAGVVHGLYTIARARRSTGNVEPETVRLLRSAAVVSPDTMVRRLALLTLASAEGLDSATAVRVSMDKDDESRRMALRGSGTLSPALRASLVRRASRDRSRIVRIEAIAAARLGATPPDCAPILALTRDRDPYVALTAIDSLGSGCADRGAAVKELGRLASTPVTTGPPDHRWQWGSHALFTLARLDSTAVARLLPKAVSSGRWEVRQYAARAAGVVGNRVVLLRLAADSDHNVEEAAIAGLATTARHDADSVYIRALGSSGYQVALAAAQALEGSSDPGALPALLDAFDRLSTGRRENAKDPRVAMLQRIGELGTTTNDSRIRPYLADFDTTVAAMAATMLTKWTGARVATRPAPLPIRPEPLADMFRRDDIRLRVTMARSAGGGSFTVQLFPDEAPATVARVLRLAREGFYNGKAFQRVEPNFVIQGGGPDANEYVGDSTFMRDELTLRTHARGTFGISARGRDTGDGQWFLNLADNPLLDHEFTIFGRLDGGQDVAERILEADRIERVEVLGDR